MIESFYDVLMCGILSINWLYSSFLSSKLHYYLIYHEASTDAYQIHLTFIVADFQTHDYMIFSTYVGTADCGFPNSFIVI